MVIPVHDSNPVRRRPVVTYLLILINILVFIVTPIATSVLGSGGSPTQICRQDAFVRHWGAIPRELTRDRPLAFTTGPAARAPNGQVGCLRVRPSYDKNPILSALTAMFVHGGWLHLLGNMLFLLIFGNNVEDRFGRLRYLVFYLGAGYIATYGYALLHSGSQEPLVGASGAIAGVLGAYIVLFPRAKVVSLVPFLLFLPLRLPAWLVLGFWFVLQYLYATNAGVVDGAAVAYEAHVVGFVVGVLVALAVRSTGGALGSRTQAPQGGWP